MTAVPDAEGPERGLLYIPTVSIPEPLEGVLLNIMHGCIYRFRRNCSGAYMCGLN
jgi:hypothetical protein